MQKICFINQRNQLIHLIRRYAKINTLNSSPPSYDVIIVGGGIIGCATAREILLRHPQLQVALLEKENRLAAHQSGRNSGVIHAGIYYLPGSLKAKLCVRGADLIYKFCDQHGIAYKKTGKLIVAVEQSEIERLNALFEKGLKNGVRDMKLVENGDEIRQYEPHARGLKAIWSPHTGIVDYGEITRQFAQDFQSRNGEVLLSSEVVGFELKPSESSSSSPDALNLNPHPLLIDVLRNGGAEKVRINTRFALCCAGLQSDRLAKLSGCSALPKIVPFRGEYLLMKPEKRHLVRSNIYPVPDPKFPFLGVHFTPRMNGDLWLGPNAVFAYKREGYRYRDISIGDTFESMTFRGTRKLATKFFAYGLREQVRSIWLRGQVKQLQRFVPELTIDDVTRGPAGVRAQALDSDGNLVDDFILEKGDGPLGDFLLHVRNAPSPAATSSLAIAEMIANDMEKHFRLEK